VGQNIANSGTVGYKRADTEFSTLVDQAGVGQTSAGGVMASTRLDVAKQGTLTGTSSSTDLAIVGNGFFVVSDASGQQYLTRSGSFVADKNGDLVNAAGYYLNGYSLANGAPTMAANSLAGMQIVNVNSTALSATPTTTGTLTANLPSTDTSIAASNLPSANASTATYNEKTSMVMTISAPVIR
jgi:flagellar hook protein FlgE